MNTTELKALAEKANFLSPDGCVKLQPHTILSLIAALESAQDERRALLVNEQNLRERVKALEEGLADAAQSLCWLAFGECRNITDRPLLTALQVEASARALLEKTT
jgi:hypothetical protein